jgi:hypothetical protein
MTGGESFGGVRPAGGNFPRKSKRGKELGLGERIRVREMGEKAGQFFLEEASTIEGAEECLVSGANW